MNETKPDPYFAERKPRRCPACRSLHVAAIVYGYPGPELLASAGARGIVLGGCCIGPADPSWRCRDCDTAIYHERLRLLYESTPDLFRREKSSAFWRRIR